MPNGDVDTSRPNVVFVTRQTTSGDFGGLAGGDAICESAASTAGLPGTFRAWLSDSSVDAPARLAGSRGWVRTDGAPVIDDLAELPSGKMFNPIDRDEDGNRLAILESQVWTGTNDNLRGTATCSDWKDPASTGVVGSFYEAVVGFTDQFLAPPCSTSARLYCFEVGHAVAVTPKMSMGRIAFVSSFVTPTNGRAELDAACTLEATQAGISGAFLAAVATETEAIASRFVGATPWRRVDGTAIVETGLGMFDGSNLISFVNQTADGRYIGPTSNLFRTGAVDAQSVGSNSSTCGSWTATTGQQMNTGRPSTVFKPDVWNGDQAGCSQPAPVLCLAP